MTELTLNQIKFDAMGTFVEIVIEGDEKLLTYSKRRIELLEKKWSRFLPHSEITKLNNSKNEVVNISNDTYLLLKKGLEGFNITKGLFDPTIFGNILRIGYDKTFSEIKNSIDNEIHINSFHRGMDYIEFIDSNSVRFPINIGYDPGGIGKGLAADLVAQEVIDMGASCAMINIGGDIRIIGSQSKGPIFDIDICDEHDQIIETISLPFGAVGTSTTRKRNWILNINGETIVQNHIVDPSPNPPNNLGVDLASVVSNEAWMCEILCKELLLTRRTQLFDLVEAFNAKAMVRTENGTLIKSTAWEKYE